MSEIVRPGIEAQSKGQCEGRMITWLGLSLGDAGGDLAAIAIHMLLALLSQFISTVKETSIGYVISVKVLTFTTGQVNASLLTKPFAVYPILSSIYFAVCYMLTQAAQLIERKVMRRRASSSIPVAYGARDPVH